MTTYRAGSQFEGLDPEQVILGGTDVITRPQTYAAGADVPLLTVCGRVTATGKLVKSVKTASDGSEVPVAISVENVASASADVIALTYIAGEFSMEVLNFHTSWAGTEMTAFGDGPIVLKVPSPLSQGYVAPGYVEGGYFDFD